MERGEWLGLQRLKQRNTFRKKESNKQTRKTERKETKTE